MHFVRRFLFVLVAALLAAVPVVEVRGDNADFDELAAPDADLAALAPRLVEISKKLRSGLDSTASGSLTILSPGAESERKAIADRLTGIWTIEAKALGSLGFSVPSEPPALVVIVVHVKGAPSSFVRAPTAPVLLLRLGDGFRAPEPPAVLPRLDGPAIQRDALHAGRAARLLRASAAAWAASRSGEAYAIARQVVASGVDRGKMPPWFYEGLVSWVESCAAQLPPQHVCKRFTVPSPALLQHLLDDKTPATLAVSRLLGRMVGALVATRMDVPKRLIDVLVQGPPWEKTLEPAFGVSADAALAAACDGLKDDGTCDENSTILCPACKGAGKLELSCPDCAGTGNLTCPSCAGVEGCPKCSDGFLYYSGGRKVKCKLCTNGKLKCQACGGTLRSQCKSCTGLGKSTWPCLGCNGGGRVACPGSGAAEDAVAGAACPWCQDPRRQSACPDCAGIGYLGCDACDGTLRRICRRCGATGEIRMVYTDGTTASSSRCTPCDGHGFLRCTECKNGRLDCSRCAGKGRGRFSGSPAGFGCPACDNGKLPTLARLGTPGATGGGIDAAEADENKKMFDRALAFLWTCNATSTGAFALREFRDRDEEAGKLETPTLFSNAKVLWAMAVLGIDREDPRAKRAWTVLRAEGEEIVKGTAEYSGTQATALAIRALAAGGDDPKGALLKGLVERLVKGQHPSGWWGSTLDEKDPDDALDSLHAVEALRVARIKGVKVPRTVWPKVLRAASSEFDAKGPVLKSGFVPATVVLSNLAIVVMAKEGSLGAKATAFDYSSLPAVKVGLAWLDRHFDIRKEPSFVKGALVRRTSDSGYSSYIFAAQRLAMLLSVEVLGGERWHATGARYLRTIQRKDGSFEETSRSHTNGAVRTTTNCLLFLMRATAPVTDVDDGD